MSLLEYVAWWVLVVAIMAVSLVERAIHWVLIAISVVSLLGITR